MVMVMTASSIVASVLVLELHHHDPTTPVPPLIRRVILDTIGRRLCILASGRRPPNRKSDHHHNHRHHHNHQNHRPSGTIRSNSTLPYLTSTGDDEYQHRPTSSSQYVAADNGVKGVAQIRKINTTENVAGLMQVNDVAVENNSFVVSSSAISVLNEILANVRFLAFRLRQNGLKNDVRDEWKLVARVFDRLMLLLFVAAICTLTLAILYFYPTNSTK